MARMTEHEWAGVQRALCEGGLREYLDNLLNRRAPAEVQVNDKNRQMMYQAYDDGSGNTVTLVVGEEGWFSGTYDDFEVFQAKEHEGTLYCIVHASGGGLVSVIVGSGLIENEMGITFHGMSEAKAYVLGLTTR